MDFVQMYRKAGRIAAEARELGASSIREGIKLLDVAESIENFIAKKGARPAFPVNLAVNNVAAHYTPSSDDCAVFKNGDLVKIDVGVHIDGFIADTARTVEVGNSRYGDMILSTKSALDKAISMMKAGTDMGKIGAAIESQIRSYGYIPIRNLTGHGLDRYKLHTGISVPNVASREEGSPKAGSAIAIEPFATNGAGVVINGEKSGIYGLIRAKPQRNPNAQTLMKHITENYRTLPFAERWLKAFSEKELKEGLRILIRNGSIRPYNTLLESGDGIVSQSEHTVIVWEDGCEVITI